MEEIKLNKAVENSSTLRIKIDNNWTVKEMVQFFESIEKLYIYYALREIIISVPIEYKDKIFAISYLILNFIHENPTIVETKRTFHIVDNKIKASSNIELFPELSIKRINMNSPGITDFTGIGTALGHIKDLIIKLIDIRISKKERDLANDKQQLENDLLKIERTKKFIALLRDAGFSEEDIKKIVAGEFRNSLPIKSLIESGKITAVE